MKKLILMTSALTMIGGAAAAEISFGAEVTLAYGDWDGAAEAGFSYSTALTATLAETTSSGVSYGATVKFTVENDDADPNNDVTSSEDGVFYISGDFGKLSFGVDEFDAIEDAAEDDAGDIQYEYSVGAFSATLTAEADLGLVGTTDWDLSVGYSAGAVTVGVDTDSSEFTELAIDYDAGNFTVGATVDTDNGWEVRAGTSFGDINAGVSYNDAEVVEVSLDGAAGDISWAVSYNTDEETTASLDYAMGDLSVGVAYDSTNAGGTGDDAETVLTVGYAFSDMLSTQLLYNSESEYELSLTAGFAF